MKFGCLGCFLLLLILAVVLIGGAAALYYGGSLFDIPSATKAEYTAADGYRAQQKLYDLATRQPQRSGYREPVVLTERELNAFLARHLEEREGIPLSPVIVKLTPGVVEVQGMTVLVNLFRGPLFSRLQNYLPTSTLERQVWVTVSGTVEVERRLSGTEREQARFVVNEFSLGNQDLGPWVLALMLGGRRQSLLQWPLPASVDGITIEKGRLVIATR